MPTRSIYCRPLIESVPVLLLCIVAIMTCPAWGFDRFITERDGRLFDGDREFRFVSWNVPNLHNVEDSFAFLGESPWRWPDEYEITDALESVRQMGGTVVRPYVISVLREDGDMGDHAHVLAPGEFNEEAFRALDQVLKTASDKGIRVIIPLVDNWRWWGGIEQYAAFRGKEAKQFWSDPQIIDDFKQTVRFVLNRRNTATGILYKDDPTILGWETGNELDSPPEWTAEIAAYIKKLDAKHLVIDGRSLHGLSLESLDNPNIDVVTTHHYPNVGNNNAESIVDAARQIGGRKAYFVGEFGFVSTEELKRMLEAVADEGVSGALFWSLRFHRREGGFYWHQEVSGDNLFKAYHWPGFASGEPYDEGGVLQTIRDSAFAIRGLEPPPIATPAAPKLLPIEDPARISWQGSAGASSYDIQRSTEKNGPWEVVGRDVSDAAVQYRPLFADTIWQTGNPYFYRVVAKNSAGESDPSNVVGPVMASHRTLVDELKDLSLVHGVSGDHQLRTKDARNVQEDIHRLALSAGASISYWLPGDIQDMRIWVFARKPDAEIRISALKPDGGKLEALNVMRATKQQTAGDYGYRQPILLTVKEAPEGTRGVRISVSETADENDVQLSRVEIRYDPKSPREATPVNSSVLIYDRETLLNAPKVVERISEMGDERVMFVVTVHCRLSPKLRPIELGLMNRRYASWEDPRNFESMSDQLLEFYRKHLAAAFQRAADLDLDIAVLPHYDPAGEVLEWRNHFDFDPFEDVNGYSYTTTLIDSCVEAIMQTAPPGTEIDFSLGGEMGRSAYMYPSSYHALANRVRSQLDDHKLKVGISFNHSDLADGYVGTPSLRKSMQELCNSLDFVGFSNYRPFEPPATVGKFSRDCENFLIELSEGGVTLPTHITLHFSEIGLGGAPDHRGRTTAARAAMEPWEGTTRPDENPWATNEMISFRRRYHKALLEFLRTQPGPRRVDAAYFWSEGSWEPLGVHKKEFVDAQIARAIREHNARSR